MNRRRIRLREHNREIANIPVVVDPKPIGACKTCRHWSGVQTGRFKTCQWPLSGFYHEPVFETNVCEYHEVTPARDRCAVCSYWHLERPGSHATGWEGEGVCRNSRSKKYNCWRDGAKVCEDFEHVRKA